MAEETNTAQISEKSRLYALLYCFFFGWAGGHRYYTNKVGTGIFMLFTGGGFGLWWFIDFIMILLGGFRDSQERTIKKWI